MNESIRGRRNLRQQCTGSRGGGTFVFARTIRQSFFAGMMCTTKQSDINLLNVN